LFSGALAEGKGIRASHVTKVTTNRFVVAEEKFDFARG